MHVWVWSHFRAETWNGELSEPPDGREPNDWVFRCLNRVEDSDHEWLLSIGYKLPSLSVGDRFKIGERGVWQEVAALGFVETGPPPVRRTRQ